MGFVYGYRNNNPAEGYVKCLLTGRKNCIKYKVGKSGDWEERLDTEFSETRAEFTPNAKQIVVFKTDADEDGTKAENKIHKIIKDNFKTCSTYGKEYNQKEIYYLTENQIVELWNKLEADKSLKLEKIPLAENWIPFKWLNELLDDIKDNLSNYSNRYFVEAYNIGTKIDTPRYTRVKNIIESKKPISDLLYIQGKNGLRWRHKDIGKWDKQKKDGNMVTLDYGISHLRHDLKKHYMRLNEIDD